MFWVFVGSCLRGTGQAMFDYADQAEKILNLPAPLFYCIKSTQVSNEDLFTIRFGINSVFQLPSWPSQQELDALLPTNTTHVYMLKSGGRDRTLSNRAINLVHAVFDGTQPHGDRYAKVSSFVPGNVPVVPHLVSPLPNGTSTRRKELSIPASDTVLCRYGGYDSFNIQYAKDAICSAVQQRTDLHFVFANTEPFCPHPRIHFLASTSTPAQKAKFIRTCDAMIHARAEGETFGIAIAEFAIIGKRVITERVSSRAIHVQELGERGIYYRGKRSLLDILLNFDRNVELKPRELYKQYSPRNVMRVFKKVFLD